MSDTLTNLIWDLRELAFEGFSHGWDGLDRKDKHAEIDRVVDAIKQRLSGDSIAVRLTRCSRDELRVIDRVLQGLERGRTVYGPLDIKTDPRDFEREAAEEFRDALVYLSAAAVALDDRRHAAGINLLCKQCGAVRAGLDELAQHGGGK